MASRALLALLTALGLALATGCGGDDAGDEAAASPSASPSPAGPLSGCHEDGDKELFVPGPDGSRTFAVEVGSGPRVVLLLHASGIDHCSWIQYGRALAAQGAHVYAVDLRGGTGHTDPAASDPGDLRLDVIAVAKHAQQQGATEIALAGASMGGAAAISTATELGVSRVVALSPPVDWETADAGAAVGSLTMPLLLVVGEKDADFPAQARELAAKAPRRLRTLTMVDSFDHGTDLLDDEAKGTPVRDLVTRFLLTGR